MSVDLSYDATNIDINQLHDELIRASLAPDSVVAGEDRVTSPNPSGGDDLVTITPLVLLSFPDGTVEAEVDDVVAAHQPMARYEPAEVLTRVSGVREVARRLADLERLQTVFNNVAGVADVPYAGAQLIKLLRSLYRDLGLL